MKKMMLSSVVICILLVSCFLLSACRTPEFMLYKCIWYSEDPEIEIFMTNEKHREGTVNNGTEEIAVEMGWGPGGEIVFYPLNVEIHSDETQLLEGEWSWDKRAKTLTITVIDDKIWNNDYPTIVLRYREV